MRTLLTIMTLVISMGFAACGSKGGGGGQAVIPPGVGGIHPHTCQVGQVHSTQYGCLNECQNQPNYGWLPGEGRCVPGTRITDEMIYGQSYQARFFGSLTIHDRSKTAELFRNARMCDPYSQPGMVGWDFGSANCSNWVDRGGFIEIKSFGSASNDLNMYIAAGTSNPNYVSYSWWGTGYIGFSQQAKAYDYNNSAGMQITGVDAAGRDVGLRAIVESGRLSNSSFQLKLYYQGVHIATSTVQRY